MIPTSRALMGVMLAVLCGCHCKQGPTRDALDFGTPNGRIKFLAAGVVGSEKLPDKGYVLTKAEVRCPGVHFEVLTGMNRKMPIVAALDERQSVARVSPSKPTTQPAETPAFIYVVGENAATSTKDVNVYAVGTSYAIWVWPTGDRYTVYHYCHSPGQSVVVHINSGAGFNQDCVLDQTSYVDVNKVGGYWQFDSQLQRAFLEDFSDLPVDHRSNVDTIEVARKSVNMPCGKLP